MSSWVLGGNYATTIAGRHPTDVGMSYAAQRYDGGNPVALSAMGDTSRTVGAMHAFDRWSLTPDMSVTSGRPLRPLRLHRTRGPVQPVARVAMEARPGQTRPRAVSQQMRRARRRGVRAVAGRRPVDAAAADVFAAHRDERIPRGAHTSCRGRVRAGRWRRS